MPRGAEVPQPGHGADRTGSFGSSNSEVRPQPQINIVFSPEGSGPRGFIVGSRRDVQPRQDERRVLSPVLEYALERRLTEDRLYNYSDQGTALSTDRSLEEKVTGEIWALQDAVPSLDRYYEDIGLVRAGTAGDKTVVTDRFSDVTTTEDLQRRAAELSERFDTLHPEDRFQYLIDMRRYNRIGLELLGHTNAYLQDVAGRRRLPDSYGVPGLRGFLETKGAQGSDAPLTFTADAEQLPEGVELPYRGIVLHDALYQAIFDNLAERTGRDVISGERLIVSEEEIGRLRLKGFKTKADNVSNVTAVEADRRSRALPDIIQEWQKRGLFDLQGIGRVDEIQERPFHQFQIRFTKISDVFFPDGNENWANALMREGDIDRAKKERYEPGKFAEHREKIVTLQEASDSAMLKVQRAFFDVAVAALQEIDKPLHPDVEERVKGTVLHLVSGGKGWDKIGPWARAHRDEIRDDPSKDNLAAFVPWVRRYAYSLGVYQDPLILEMQQRCEAQGLDYRDVAASIKRAAAQRKELGDAYKPEKGETQWFVREALDVISTVDDRGRYDPDPQKYEHDPQNMLAISKVVPRSEAAIADIVERLSAEESSRAA